jgi:hypothetical protein
MFPRAIAMNVVVMDAGYQRLDQILDEKNFDEYVKEICKEFYADEMGRREWRHGFISGCGWWATSRGIDSERGIRWRARPVSGITVSGSTLR